MSLPHNVGRLPRIRDFVRWKTAVEAILRQHDTRLAAPTSNVILTSPDGTRHLLQVEDDGTLSTTPV